MGEEVVRIEVAAGVVFRDGRLLITQRRAGDHLGGLWEFPGGKRRPNEDFEECLSRELKEELGIEVAVGQLLEETDYTYPAHRVLLRFYRCLWLRNEPRPLGCQAFAWVVADQLDGLSFPPADIPLLRKLCSSPWS